MLIVQPALRPPRKPRTSRVGVAIAGGGPTGGMYELGALRALDDVLDGVDLTQLDVYVGVSSGAFLAAGLANGLSTTEMCRIFVTGESDSVKFRPETFLRPAFGEYAKRIAGLPGIVRGWVSDLVRKPLETNWTDVLGRFGALIPTGVFDNEGVEVFLREVFEAYGRSNDFRKLPRRLYVVAVELDTGETVRFGAKGLDHVPISRAVQASSALPGLYPPVVIDGRFIVDGALRRTLHASVAMEEGMDLVLGLNPLVPYDAALAARSGGTQRLVDGGLPTVLSQTFRTILKSRMQVGLDKYQQQYPATDLVLFEPNPDDGAMFFTNVFSYDSRLDLTAHAYRATLDDLRRRRAEIEPLLARRGIGLRHEILEDRKRTLFDSLGPRKPRGNRATAKLHRVLDDLEAVIKPKRKAVAKLAKPRKRVTSPR